MTMFETPTIKCKKCGHTYGTITIITTNSGDKTDYPTNKCPKCGEKP